jgi:(E)-2-((N-methylformamido)methylene)succinate hydrolase
MIWTTRPRCDGPGGLAYWQSGAGPVLVLIHGVGLRAEAWASIAASLTRRFTVHAVDMPGHGQSPLGAASSLADYSRAIGALIDTLGGPVLVAGHSMGAMIALDLAARMPGRVAGVAALNAIYRRDAAAEHAVRARAAALDGIGPVDPTAPLARWFGAAPSQEDAEAAAACKGWLRAADPASYAAAYGVFAHADGPEDTALAALPMPTLFISGARDRNSTPDMTRAMAALAPQGRAKIIAEAGHMMPMTHGGPAAAALLAAFDTEGAA